MYMMTVLLRFIEVKWLIRCRCTDVYEWKPVLCRNRPMHEVWRFLPSVCTSLFFPGAYFHQVGFCQGTTLVFRSCPLCYRLYPFSTFRILYVYWIYNYQYRCYYLNCYMTNLIQSDAQRIDLKAKYEFSVYSFTHTWLAEAVCYVSPYVDCLP